ncbi:cytidylate kinase-like family protein [Oceanobacillus sp. FSL K6-2867]|uniref:cytidylate kinase-like family protein n=1 Tax=Oceanobacillus sp. FSL K6-2867 TaxID=2954748 RepID=UPI0030D8DC8A
MTKKYIVLTSEFGSGARLVGKHLSEELGIPFYGEENLLIKTAKESGIEENVLRDYDEKLANMKVDDDTVQSTNDSNADLSSKIFKAYSGSILKAVQEGPCILMERGADIVLKGKVDFLNVYTYTSDISKKIERCIRVSGVAEENALDFIHQQSKLRELYYKSFSNIERGKMSEYDLCLNTDAFVTNALDMSQCAEIIKSSLGAKIKS